MGKVEIDCRKAAPKEKRVGKTCESTDQDRLTEGWPEGRSIGDDASQRLPKAAQRVNAVNQFAGFLGLTGKSICQQTEFLDIINKIVIIELRSAGAFVARMWLSKSKLPQASLRPFRFLTANPGKP